MTWDESLHPRDDIGRFAFAQGVADRHRQLEEEEHVLRHGQAIASPESGGYGRNGHARRQAQAMSDRLHAIGKEKERLAQSLTAEERRRHGISTRNEVADQVGEAVRRMLHKPKSEEEAMKTTEHKAFDRRNWPEGLDGYIRESQQMIDENNVELDKLYQMQNLMVRILDLARDTSQAGDGSYLNSAMQSIQNSIQMYESSNERYQGQMDEARGAMARWAQDDRDNQSMFDRIGAPTRNNDPELAHDKRPLLAKRRPALADKPAPGAHRLYHR